MSAGIIMFASQYSLKSCHISGFTSACRYPSWIVLLCARMLEASAYVSALSFQSSNSSWLTESHSFSGLRSLATETLLGGSLWCCLCCYLALSHCQFCPEFWKERVPIFVILLPFPVLQYIVSSHIHPPFCWLVPSRGPAGKCESVHYLHLAWVSLSDYTVVGGFLSSRLLPMLFTNCSNETLWRSGPGEVFQFCRSS